MEQPLAVGCASDSVYKDEYMRFEKYEGLGNDFILVDLSRVDPSEGSRLAPSQAPRIAPSGGSQIDPSKGSQADPSKGSQTDPSKGSQVDPSGGSQIDPSRRARIDPGARSQEEANDRHLARDVEGFSAERVAQLCDRHRGIGADGVLLVLPGQTQGAAGRMVVLNADGSRPEMCGNGLRCVVGLIARRLVASRTPSDRDEAIAMIVDTDAGPRACEARGELVSIDMGVAVDEGVIELTPGDAGIPAVSSWNGALRLRKIRTGNPHAIVLDPPAAVDAAFGSLGPALAVHGVFPEGSNVEFARVLDPRRIDVRVWERGVGPTLACGTGACATVVAACLEGRCDPGVEVTVGLPGGVLYVTVRRDLGITMRGPARRVFSGEIAS